MILIADSGSTKTDWACVADGRLFRTIPTQGINPVHQSAAHIKDVINGELLPMLASLPCIDAVFFYGAGCIPSKVPEMAALLSEEFKGCEKVTIDSDLMAAARALFGHEAGLACILGTGANTCVYDGNAIVGNIPPLGYILGDEGSGAVLGKRFLNAIFKGGLSNDLKEEYLAWSGLAYEEIINRVYRQPMANRFLASVSLFIFNHLENSGLRDLVKGNFRDFFHYNLCRYQRHDLAVGVVGSVAWSYRELLEEVATEEGFQLHKVLKGPLDGLVKYHS